MSDLHILLKKIKNKEKKKNFIFDFCLPLTNNKQFMLTLYFECYLTAVDIRKILDLNILYHWKGT